MTFLSAEQALADYAEFLYDMKRKNPEVGPVIAIGGSYGGMLSGNDLN